MLTILILFITGILTLFASFFSIKKYIKYIAIAGVITALVCLSMKLHLGIHFAQFFDLEKNVIGRMMTAVILFILFFIFLFSDRYEKEYDWSATTSLMLFSSTGAILLLGCYNLLTLFLGIEILSIPLYIMAASRKNNQFSLEAGLKYFILGSFSSAFLLFGIALVYGMIGSFDNTSVIEIQSKMMSTPSFFQIGIMMILLSVVFKMALAPFHFWAPDVYDGSPTIVTTFMTTIVKISATIAMYWLVASFFTHQFNIFAKYLIIIIGLSLLIGSVLGLVQKSVKRLLAYSSVSHAAFILLAVLIAIPSQNPSIIPFYLIVYTLSSLIVFLIINEIAKGHDLSLDSLNGFAKANPVLGFCFMIAVFSMAGIPFTGGFIAKYTILSYLISFNILTFILALLASAIGIVYYLKLINRIYFFENSIENVAVKNILLSTSVVILSILIIILGLSPTLIMSAIQRYFI